MIQIFWLARYEQAYYFQFSNLEKVDVLDNEGTSLCKKLGSELVDSKVEYFSHAKMQIVPVA